MFTVLDLLNSKISISKTKNNEELLMLNDFVIAAKSWHLEFDKLITCPPTGYYKNSWLSQVYGGDYPDFSPVVRGILLLVFNRYEDEIFDYFETDPINRDKDLLNSIEDYIKILSKKHIEKTN